VFYGVWILCVTVDQHVLHVESSIRKPYREVAVLLDHPLAVRTIRRRAAPNAAAFQVNEDETIRRRRSLEGVDSLAKEILRNDGLDAPVDEGIPSH
jgi:hypothetical protein